MLPLIHILKIPGSSESQRLVKNNIINMSSIAKTLNYYASQQEWNDGVISTSKLRSRLMSTDNADPQFRLWPSERDCSNSGKDSSQVCASSGRFTFGSMPNLTDPFWAQPRPASNRDCGSSSLLESALHPNMRT